MLTMMASVAGARTTGRLVGVVEHSNGTASAAQKKLERLGEEQTKINILDRLDWKMQGRMTLGH
jgi:hypothetical protein